MIDSDHPQPRSIEEIVIENNAMLNKVLHNQACMMEMIAQLYQFSYKKEFGVWPSSSPHDKTNKGRAAIAEANFETYKNIVSKIYHKLLLKVKIHV